MKVGVLALQGDFAEHIKILKRLDVEAVEVRLPKHLDELDALSYAHLEKRSPSGALAQAQSFFRRTPSALNHYLS
jgi:hypothetical protein